MPLVPSAPPGPAARPSLGLPLALLWLAAVLLALTGLGSLPLRDWDEGIVARVALELSQGEGGSALLPTFWGGDYLNKPPGLHWLIAGLLVLLRPEAAEVTAAATGGVPLPPPAWMVRLVPALLSTLVVPLGGLIQAELRPGRRLPALATAAVLLCLLPVARHGRLAMLDGTQLSLIAALWLCLLHLARRPLQSRPALLAGLAGSGLLLLKAPMLLPVLALGLTGLAIDPRRPLAVRTPAGRPVRAWALRRWLPLLLAGLLPGLAWHICHAWMRGDGALWLWWGDGAGRVLLETGEGSDLGWRVPVTEILEGGWPWLALWPFGVLLAWRERDRPSGRWPLLLQFGLAAVILPLRTQLPWYGHPLWLPFALLVGPVLAWLIDRRCLGDPSTSAAPTAPGAALLRRVPLLWAFLGAALMLAGLTALLPIGPAALLTPYRGVLLMAGAGWCAGGLLLMRPAPGRRRLGGLAMVAGSGLGLMALMASPLWLWELNETWATPPVAALTRRWQAQPVSLWQEAERPSLSWYAGQRIRSASDDDDLRTDPQGEAWVLRRGGDAPGDTECRWVDGAEGLSLWRCRPEGVGGQALAPGR
ncbi:4-amino-4-deoxy-L-arabinose transferase [Cyanobium sp. FGCU-52]|nr:4-amino-4-deoxy-L-arabinose transferase [Cyanobium sp. FGCU52]